MTGVALSLEDLGVTGCGRLLAQPLAVGSLMTARMTECGACNQTHDPFFLELVGRNLRSGV